MFWLTTALVFFLLSLVSTVFGTLAGSALFLVPGMLVLGVPAYARLGTVRPVYFVNAIVASLRFKKRGYVVIKEGITMLGFAFIGALIGAIGILQIGQTVTTYIIVAVALVSSFLLLIKREVGEKVKKSKPSFIKLSLIGFLVGILSGAVGFGGGIISALSLMYVEGYSMKQSLALGNVRAIGNQLAALIVFGLSGLILWDVALFLMIGGILGSYLGVEVAHRISNKKIKYIFILGAVLLALKILFP